MKVKRKKTFDVFISHRRVDSSTAQRVADNLSAIDLVVYDQAISSNASRFGDDVREALAESRVLLVILSKSSLRSATIALEVGAARAWQKAVYVLLVGVVPKEMPPFLQELDTFTVSRIPALINAIRDSASPLTLSQQAILARVYESSSVPSDQLARRPMALERLTRRFNNLASTTFAPERLLQELIRLRKKGKLGPISR